MQTLRSFLLVIVVAVAALAQQPVTASTPPDIEIVFSHVGTRTSSQLVETERRLTTSGLQYTGAYPAELGTDPRNVRYVTDLSRQQVSTKYALLRIKNIGAKTIKAIEWEAPQMNFKNDQLLWRLVIKSKVDLEPGETTHLKQTLQQPKKRLTMTAMSGSGGTYTFPQTGGILVMQYQGEAAPPIQAVTFTTEPGKSFTIPADWQRQPISIKRIEYADGSVWQQ